MYPKVQMFIAGEWTDGTSGKSEDILNPATGQAIGKTPHASRADLDRALEASKAGFEVWRKTSPFDRYKLMRKAADIIRSRAAEIAPIMTMEQGKPVVEAQGETCWPATSSTGFRRKPAAPMAASCRPGWATSPSS